MPNGVKIFLLRWFITTLGVLLAAEVVDGVRADTMAALLAASLLLGILNAILRPFLLIVALPLLVVTLGLFTLVINAVLLYFVGSVIRGFHVYGFWPAFKGALLISLVSIFSSLLLGKKEIQVRTKSRPGVKPSTDTGNGPIIDV